MAEHQIKFDYQNPDNVEAEVPGAQKLRVAQFETNKNDGNSSKSGENASNNDETPSNNENQLKLADNSEENHTINHFSNSQTEVHSEVKQEEVVTRHRQILSRKRNGIHGEPVMMEGKEVEDKKSRTKIPVSRFRQTVERVKTERRGSKDMKAHESHIPVRRTSIPKPVNENKLPVSTVKKKITITKTEVRQESSEPTITTTIIKKEINEPTSTKTVISEETSETTNKTEIKTETTEPEDEFDKIYAEIVVNTPTEVVFDDNLLNPKVEDPEKLESKFEEIIHDYDEHKVEPIDVEVVRRSKIPFLKRKSQQEIELSAQADRTSKIIAARDKLRLRHSQTKDESFEDELDKELNKTQANFEVSTEQQQTQTNIKTEREIKHEVVTSQNSKTEVTSQITKSFSTSHESENYVFDQLNEKLAPTIDTTSENETKHEVITSLNSKTEITSQFTKAVSASSSKEEESTASSTFLETSTIKEVKTYESNDKKENKQQFLTEENLMKDSIKIGIPVFNSYVHEFSDKDETAKTFEVKTVFSYKSNTEGLSIANNVSEIKNEVKETKIGTVDIEHQASKANDIKVDGTQLAQINDNSDKSIDIDIDKPKTKPVEETLKVKETRQEDDTQLRGKVGRLISKIDSKEVIETEGNQRESINELTKKKSVLSKIAMFERKEASPISIKAPNHDIKLPNQVTEDVQTVEHTHVHTPLIVDEVIKPFETDIDLKHYGNKEESTLKSDDKTIVRAERVTVESPDSVHYAVENRVQIESETLVQESKVSNETVNTQANIDSKYTAKKVEIAAITNVQPSKSSIFDNISPTIKDLDKYEDKYIQTIHRSTSKLNMTKELQGSVTIAGFKPVSELLKSFEYKKDRNGMANRSISKEHIIEKPLKTSEIVSHENITTEILTTNIVNKNATYDDFEYVNDYKSLDDVFSKENDFHKLKRQDDEMQRAKSLAELDLGDAVKGKVCNIVLRMKSVDRIEFDRIPISKKEMPRKRSVSEKIALFEGKLTPSKSESPLPLRIFKADKLTETSRKEKKIEKIQTRTETNKYSKNIDNSVSVTEKSVEGRSDKNDEEAIQKKIEELSNAKLKYGTANMTGVKLSNGIVMPVLAVGTALLDPRLTFHVISAAIDLGYRAIDTAYIYGNEKSVGDAIRAKIADGTVKREELFVISKLWSTFHRGDLTEAACRASLDLMGLEYFDLYLVHNPMSFKEGGGPIPKIATVIQYSEHDYLDAWYGLEKLVSKGLVRAIGVSNFNSLQLQRVLDKGKVKPVVNQIECHPYLSQQRLDLFCSERNVTLSCFGVLGSKGTPAELKSAQTAVIDDALVQVMASGLGVTPAQLLISYQLENGHGVVVKSSSAAHLWDNLQALNVHLTMGQVDALHALNRNKRIFTFKGMGDTHKNYPFNIAF